MRRFDVIWRSSTVCGGLFFIHVASADPIAAAGAAPGVTFAQLAAPTASATATTTSTPTSTSTTTPSATTTAHPKKMSDSADTPPQSPPPAPPPMTLAQRQAADLLNNAQRLDATNRDLLADKQKQALQIEQLQTEISALRADRSNEGIREGACVVVVGFLLGWFFAGRRRKSW